MSSISFGGLATGLDTGMIVSQLVELKRAPIYRLQTQKKGFQNQISALGTLKSKLIALQDAAKTLDTANEFSSLKSTSSDEDYLTVKAGSDAAPGSYDIKVLSLAQTQKDVSQGYDSLSDSVGTGILSFTVDGATTDLNLVGYTSLESLAQLINDNVDGMSASIINDGSETGAYRLVLSGEEAGSAGAFTVDASGVSGGVTPIFTNQQAASDASLEIDGIPVTATSNNADDIISGLTLNLNAISVDAENNLDKTIRVDVGIDTEGVAEKVSSFVDAYNDLFSYIQEQSKTEGDLRSNPTLRAVASRIENIFSTSLEGGLGDITNFAQIGITRSSGDRQLTFKQDEFIEALEDDFSSVRDLFIEREGNLGKTYLIDTAIENMTDSIDGLFKISTDALNKKIDYTDQGIERYERSVEAYQTTLERKFTAMEMMVSQLQAQGNYLASVQY
jgi:flagellar hook-associated protein 2